MVSRSGGIEPARFRLPAERAPYHQAKPAHVGARSTPANKKEKKEKRKHQGELSQCRKCVAGGHFMPEALFVSLDFSIPPS